MKRDKLKIAIAEAERFIKRAKALPPPSDYGYQHPVESGALRRSSMDLTRALADLRKPS